MRLFYLLLVLVAVVAAVLMWKGSRGGSSDVSATAAAPVIVTAADSAFKGFVLGAETAPVEVIEYADFQCPHCGEFANVQFPTIKEQLINTGRLRWRFREYPLPSFPWSRTAALAAQCVGEQGKFWEMEEALFQRQSDWGTSRKNPSAAFRDLAHGVGVDVDKYDTCVDSQRYAGRIEASYREGTARGVTGTPTFFVNGRELDTGHYGNSDAFKNLVDSLTGKGRH
jgi:protein-disulfide isomerase